MQEDDSNITVSTETAEGHRGISEKNKLISNRRSSDLEKYYNDSVAETEVTESTDEIVKPELHARTPSLSITDSDLTNGNQENMTQKIDLISTNNLQHDYSDDLKDAINVTEVKNNIHHEACDENTIGICEKNQETLLKATDYIRKSSMSSPVQSHRKTKVTPQTTKYSKSFHWVAQHHKKIGFRHICLLLVVLAYTLLGASVFYLIEANYEENLVATRLVALDTAIEKIAIEMKNAINNHQTEVNVSTMEKFVKNAYVTLLQQESAYKGSTFYKAADPANNYKWTFGSAFFFSMNVFTTTGYGSIAPESVAGKSCVIWYGLIFVPLTLVVIRDLGQWTLVFLTKIYALVQIKFRVAMGYPDSEEDEIITLPIKFCLSLMAGYLLFASIFIYEYDALSGSPQSGIDFFHSFYFSFISLSTIGLGDIMPSNVTFAPVITILFFFGMPIMKVVNRVTYVCLENGVFGTMSVLENRLENVWSNIRSDTENQITPPLPSVGAGPMSRCSYCSGMQDEIYPSEEDTIRNEMLNNFTIRSIATFMRTNSDVYGGGFGRVNLRRGDLIPSNVDSVCQ